MQIAPLASGSTRGLARQQVTGESDDTDRSHTRCIGHDMITMGTKALTRGIEQLDLLVAALCGVVLLPDGYDIAAIGYAVPSIAGPGRPGTPPARHYDLAARSSLHGSGRQLPAVVGRRAPKETEARPRGPKPPRWSASVPRHGTQGASLGAWRAALCARPTGAAAPERFSALRPPLDSG